MRIIVSEMRETMNPKGEALEDLRESGYKFLRRGHDHDIYWNEELKSRIPVSRGTKFDKTDRDKIRQEIKQAKRRKGQK